MSTTVFVSGATGFIAQNIIKELLSKDYKVIGSVRSEKKGQDLEKLINSSNFKYTIVPEIGTPGAFDETLKKIQKSKLFYILQVQYFSLLMMLRKKSWIQLLKVLRMY